MVIFKELHLVFIGHILVVAHMLCDVKTLGTFLLYSSSQRVVAKTQLHYKRHFPFLSYM